MSSTSHGWDPDYHPIHRLIELGDSAASMLNRVWQGVSDRWVYPHTPREDAIGRLPKERIELVRQWYAFTRPLWTHYRYPVAMRDSLICDAVTYLRDRRVRPGSAQRAVEPAAVRVADMFLSHPPAHPMHGGSEDEAKFNSFPGWLAGWWSIRGPLIRLLATAEGEPAVPLSIHQRFLTDEPGLSAALPNLSGQAPSTIPARPAIAGSEQGAKGEPKRQNCRGGKKRDKLTEWQKRAVQLREAGITLRGDQVKRLRAEGHAITIPDLDRLFDMLGARRRRPTKS